MQTESQMVYNRIRTYDKEAYVSLIEAAILD